MTQSWKLVAHGSKAVIQSALAAHELIDDWDYDIVLTGSEIAEDMPDEWVLEAYMSRKPTKMDRLAVNGLFRGGAPKLTIEELPDTDWVVTTQMQVEPIRSGRFHIHTREYPAINEPGVVDFTIPAAQAFGTGQHATTAGCLLMLDAMKKSGMAVRNVADIGTGTGLLAFAAMALWPGARAIASDIDAVCAPVVSENAALNGFAEGRGPGALEMVIAEGMNHPRLAANAPYDLLIANILAGPLVSLAGDFADAVRPGGSLLLAGLLETQEASVRAAYRTAGFRLAARQVRGDWSILWMRRRP